jgi:signal transduction histidine kinase/CheY-like chemotaxis protein
LALQSALWRVVSPQAAHLARMQLSRHSALRSRYTLVKAMPKIVLSLAAVPISGAAVAYNVFERLEGFASTQGSSALHTNLQFLFAALVLGVTIASLTALLFGLLIHRNIRVQKTVEAARLDEGALQKAIFNSANFSSIATDAKGVIQIFNVGAERMLGYAAKDVVNRITPADISDPREVIVRATALSAELGSQIAPGFEALVFKASRGIEDIYELTYLHKDGSRLPAVVSVTALRDAAGGIIGYLLIGTDNTARKQIEADRALLDQALLDKNGELEAAKSAAEKANLAKSDFLSNMSHELRSPLNAILGFAQLIESSAPPPTASQARSVEQILKAGWYLLDLINEILDLALIESGKLSLSMEPMTLNDLLQECQAMIEPEAQKRGVTITFPCLPEPHNVQADRTRVKQVLINLLSNAIKYNRERGMVVVRCEATAAGRIRIAVEDTGAGLGPEKLSQLFQPFNRLGQESGTEQGTGIGLVVSRRLVEMMGGEIGATSTLGVGSVFWVELNSTDAALAFDDVVDPVSAALVQADGATQRTLLYIEDNPANLMLVEDIISRRTDIRLINAQDGIRGVEMALKWLPDIILMDINLPGISGLQALEILAQLPATAHIPVVALSANALPRDIAKGLEAGFFRYLTKPIKIDEFRHTLDESLTFAKAKQAGAPLLESAS